MQNVDTVYYTKKQSTRETGSPAQKTTSSEEESSRTSGGAGERPRDRYNVDYTYLTITISNTPMLIKFLIDI